MRNNIKLSFNVSENTNLSCFDKSGRKTLSCIVADGNIRCDIYYDFKDEPLSLYSDIS